MSPARAGAFNANFAPDTLENFKQHCKQNNKQYTKVLEKLAELYLQSDGAILSVPEPLDTAKATVGGVDPNEFKNLLQTVLDLTARVKTLEQQPSSNDLVKRMEHVEKAVQYKLKKLEK